MGWAASVDTEMTITFEDQDGKTLLTMVQTGFEREEDRDGFMGGWPTYLDTLKGVVGKHARASRRGTTTTTEEATMRCNPRSRDRT